MTVHYKNENLAYFANAHLYFVMATVLYLLYITTMLYLNATYTVSSTKNTNDDNRYKWPDNNLINVVVDNVR